LGWSLELELHERPLYGFKKTVPIVNLKSFVIRYLGLDPDTATAWPKIPGTGFNKYGY
jgi:hypothetical protein